MIRIYGKKTHRAILAFSAAAHLFLLLFLQFSSLETGERKEPKAEIHVEFSVETPEPPPPPPPKPRRERPAPAPVPEEVAEEEPPAPEAPKHWSIPVKRRVARKAPDRVLKPSERDLALPADPRKPDTIPPLWKSESVEPAGVGIEQANTVDSLGNKLPDYPLEMRHAGRPGMVEVGILVDTLGNVENAVPLQIRGDLKFAYHTVRAVKGWSGFPVRTDSAGTKVWYWVRKKFFFDVDPIDPIHDPKGQRRNIYDNVPEEKNYGKMLYEHAYHFK